MLVFGGATLIGLVAFVTLILVPAVGSFDRGWEKATAVLLSGIVLVALVVVGLVIGGLVVYFWNDISAVFE